MDERDIKQIAKLAQEGKQISKISDDFPQYDYWQVYWAVYGAGEKGPIGTRKIITNQLHKLAAAAPDEQEAIIGEINELVWNLYNRYRESQKKLDAIREIIKS